MAKVICPEPGSQLTIHGTSDPVLPTLPINYEKRIRSLETALKEALDGWEGFGLVSVMESDWPRWKRITELRKLIE